MFAAIWCVAAAGWVIGLVHPSSSDHGAGRQLVDLLRVTTTLAMVVTLVLGPGLACRALRPGSLSRLGFVPLVGLTACLVAGGITWGVALAGWVHPRIVATIVLAPVMLALPFAVRRARGAPLLDSEERWALIIAFAALLIATGRSLWSPNAPGELYAGTIYRTLEVSDRPDSRISYHVVELVANGARPYGSIATAFFSPYTFSDRGPFPGIASAPIALLSGGRPPSVIGTPPWTPFDPEGFMAYRLAMMTFATTSFLALWSAARKLAGDSAARCALLLCATTPFLVHEIWFTWPKLLAASLVILAAISLFERHTFRSGLLVGLGYLCHPLTMLSLPALGLGALWPQVRPKWRRPAVGSLVLLVVGCAISLIAWRLVNGSHYTQSGFLDYVEQDGFNNTLRGYPVTVGAWLADRGSSIGNTLVPGGLFLFRSDAQEINAVQACFPFCRGGSPTIVHFFYQYWTGVPFGLGILFYPLLLVSLWRAARRWPWPVFVSVLVPFVTFAVYWGGASTGLLREGMHAWVLTLVIVVAVQQSSDGFPYLRHRILRIILVSRVVEVLLVAMLATAITSHQVIGAGLAVNDLAAIALMVIPAAFLGFAIWREGARLVRIRQPTVISPAS